MSRTRTSSKRRDVPLAVAFAACFVAVLLGLFGPEAAADSPATQVDAGTAVDGAARELTSYTTARSEMPDGAEVPEAFLPPGSRVSPEPSEKIFPPQSITIRFNHKKHVKELKQSCKVCHAAAFTSDSVDDRLIPKPAETCDACHDVDHSDRNHVKAGKDPDGQCAFCHTSFGTGPTPQPLPMVLPRANMHFTHVKHLARNIQCAQCHGQIEELELATRSALPRMAGCFTCHNMSGAAQGEAKGTCTTCHLTLPDGRLQTAFTTGMLEPPRWLHQAGHTPDWLERHKMIAADDSAFCGSCHTASYCTDCHDGKVRPRNVHPNDFLSMHPQAARQDNPRCVSCHQLQTFCADCHRRTGVARDVASDARASGRRFHPPPSEWTNAPRGPNHHAWEAARNLNACVSCHTERDCATCHATKGINGGMGVNPHPSGFSSKCGLALRRNPRPCLVCHQQGDRSLRMCQ
jgi:hypothetical protein